MTGDAIRTATTLVGLLEHSGTQVIIYDMGRRIGAIPASRFAAFEAASAPYPRPMQHKAWFSLVQRARNDAAMQPVIWFLHLSLDEQGLLVPAERDYLVSRLIGSAQADRNGGDAQAFLRDNPHAFTPREERMALLHARLSADLGLPPSRFYDHALDYFRGKPGWDRWEFVGYQGIADVACRHNGLPLSDAIAPLPAPPLVALCHCLESQTIDDTLAGSLVDRLRSALVDEPVDIAVVAALIRGLASRAADAAVTNVLVELLDHPASENIEILAAIGGRAWEALEEPGVLNAYLARLAGNSQGQIAFDNSIRDLLSLPSLADTLRSALRSPEQPQAVRDAFNRTAKPS